MKNKAGKKNINGQSILYDDIFQWGKPMLTHAEIRVNCEIQN